MCLARSFSDHAPCGILNHVVVLFSLRCWSWWHISSLFRALQVSRAMGHLKAVKEENEASYLIARKAYSKLLRKKHMKVCMLVCISLSAPNKGHRVCK